MGFTLNEIIRFNKPPNHFFCQAKQKRGQRITLPNPSTTIKKPNGRPIEKHRETSARIFLIQKTRMETKGRENPIEKSPIQSIKNGGASSSPLSLPIPMAHSELHGQDLPQVLLIRFNPIFAQILSKTSHNFQFLKAWDSNLPLDQFLAAHAAAIHALVTSSMGAPVTSEVLRLLPSLKLIVTLSAGLDHIDIAECRSRGVAVASSSEIFAADVADMAVGLFIDVMRKISASDRFVRDGFWVSRGAYALGSTIGGKRVGIVGLGHIGLEVAKRLEAFGCKILYHSRKEKPAVSFPFYPDLYELAVDSDALVICCGWTAETHHMISKKILLALGREGVIVNIGRGPIIDEKEMVQCLVEGEIAGAGLDVFENEPEVPKELFALDNVVLSPHLSGLTPEALTDLTELAMGNLEAFFSNKPLLSRVENN